MQFSILFSIMLLLVASSVAGPGQTSQRKTAPVQQAVNCSTATDEEIVDLILKSLRAAFPNLNARKYPVKQFKDEAKNVRSRDKNLNVFPTCKDHVVSLTGTVANAKMFAHVIEVIKNLYSPTKGKISDCIKIIDVKNFSSDGADQCDGGLKLCNGECKPPNAPCPPVG